MERELRVSVERGMSGLAGRLTSVWITSFLSSGPGGLGFVPGWSGASPRGESTRILKCPVKGGPRADGRVSASI